MCRNKWALALCLCLCLSSVNARAQSDNYMAPDSLETGVVTMEMALATYGTLAQETSANGEVYLPHTYKLCPEADGLTFVEYTVNRNDVVQAGDVLAVFESSVDEAALEEKKRLLSRTRDAFEQEKVRRQDAIEAQYLALLSLQDGYEARMAQLSLKRAEIDFERYVFQQTAAIEDIESAIEAMEAERRESLIVAPVDGIIDRTLSRRVGDRIGRDEIMVIMYSTEDALLKVSNKMGTFRYGMPVTITAGTGTKAQTLTGRVVGEDLKLSDGQKTGIAYIKPDYYDPVTTPTDNIKVFANTKYLENVLMIPRNAIAMASGKQYVTQWRDGVAQKKYIQAFVNRQQAWVLRGLDAGEGVIAD